VITGVSGSGKSTLVKDILFPAVKNIMGAMVKKPDDMDILVVNYGIFQQLNMSIKTQLDVPQDPILQLT